MANEDNVGSKTEGQDDDLHALIGQAFDEMEAEQEGDETTTEDSIEDSIEDPNEDSSDETQDDDQADASDDADESEGDDDEEGEEGDETETLEAPEHWSADDKAAFSELPDETKPLYLEKVKQLESGFNKKFEEVADYRKEREALDDMFKPFEPQMAQAGVNRVQYIQNLVQAERALSNPQTREQAFQYLAQQYGVDLGRFGQSQDDDEDLDPSDKKVRELEAKVQQFEQGQRQAQQQAQQAQQQDVQSQIEAFKNASDDKGQPKHPHFEAVKTHMGALIQSGAADSMDTAYEQAVYAVPELRAKMLESAQKQQAAEREKTRKAEVKKAKKAARNVTSANSDAKPNQDDMSIRDMLKHNLDESIGA